MQPQSFAGGFSYLYILVGLVLSFVSALAPHYNAGYHLMTGVLIAGILPYLVYAVAVPLLHDNLTKIAGFVLVVAHAWLVVDKRLLEGGVYDDDVIYAAPVVMAVVLLPLAIKAMRRPRT